MSHKCPIIINIMVFQMFSQHLGYLSNLCGTLCLIPLLVSSLITYVQWCKWHPWCLMKVRDIPNVNYMVYLVHMLINLRVGVSQIVIKTDPIVFTTILHSAQWWHHIALRSMINYTTHNLITNPYCTKSSGIHTTHSLVVRI